MDNLQLFNFEGNKLRSLMIDEVPYFVAKDATRVLGYQDYGDALKKHVDAEDKISKIVKASQIFQNGKGYVNVDLINESGLYSLILASRMPKAISLGKALGLNLRNSFIKCDEAQTLYAIEKSIDGLYSYEPQYPCGAYRIDLYLPEYKIAIECDELGHADRDKEYEDIRQKYIEKHLGCSFVRYNPDSKKFNMFCVINKVLKEIRNKQSVNEEE